MEPLEPISIPWAHCLGIVTKASIRVWACTQVVQILVRNDRIQAVGIGDVTDPSESAAGDLGVSKWVHPESQRTLPVHLGVLANTGLDPGIAWLNEQSGRYFVIPHVRSRRAL